MTTSGYAMNSIKGAARGRDASPYSDDPAPAPIRIGEIVEQFQEQDQILMLLDELVGQLLARTHCVRRSDPPEAANRPQAVLGSPFGETILAHNTRLREQVARLGYILHTLELP